MKFLNSLKNEKSKNIYFDSVINSNAETAVIFLHGLIGSRRYWDEKYKTLSKKYHLNFFILPNRRHSLPIEAKEKILKMIQ